MKKVLVIVLAMVFLLTACAERIPESTLEESIKDVSQAPTGSFDQPFLVTDLAGSTQEELFAYRQSAIYYNDAMMERALHTPYVIYLKTDAPTLLSYDKATGAFASACRDPLCDHESCLWGSGDMFLYCGTDGLFFLLDNGKGQIIYSTDFFGGDIKKRYESTDCLSHLVQEEEYLYFLQEGVGEETDSTVGTVVRLNLQDGKTEDLLTMEGLYYFMPLGGKILYMGDGGHSLYDPVTGETVPYGDEDLIPLLLYGEHLYYQKAGTLYRKGNYGMGNEETMYEKAPSELFFDGQTVYFYGADNVIYKTTADFSQVEVYYKPETDSRISDVAIHGNLLFYTYTTGSGSVRKSFVVMIDLATEDTLEVRT